VSLALKVNSLVGTDAAPARLAIVAGVGSLFSIVSNPLCGRLSDRTTSRWGRRRPWMVGGVVGGAVGVLVVALAPTIGWVLVGWCLAQVSLNAVLAAQVAVLPDQVPAVQRGVVSGVLGVCVPLASVAATWLVQRFDAHQLTMFLVPCAVGSALVLLFVLRLPDRRIDPVDRPPWSRRELLGSFWVSPRRHPDFAWAFCSRFLFVLAYAFLVTFQTYYLLEQVGSAEDDVAHTVYLGTLVQSATLVVVAPVAGRLSDRTGRRKVFVIAAAVVYGVALGVVATGHTVDQYLLGMAIGGAGFGTYMAVDLALVVDVLPAAGTAARDLGVLNIAGALPFALAPALAPAVLGLGGGSYAALYLVAAACALGAAAAVVPIRRVR
jgi:MFS family permease